MDDAYIPTYIQVDQKRYQFLKQERDRLPSENEYLRYELQKTEQRISDLRWQTNPDRMGK